MWQEKFLPRWAGRKKVWVIIQRKLKELEGNLWEFSSDVLNFPREVGGEVIFWEQRGRGGNRPEGEWRQWKAAVVNSMTGSFLWVIKRVTTSHWAELLGSTFSVYSVPAPFGRHADKGQKSLYMLKDLLKEGEIVKGKNSELLLNSQGRLYRGAESLDGLDLRTQRKSEE